MNGRNDVHQLSQSVVQLLVVQVRVQRHAFRVELLRLDHLQRSFADLLQQRWQTRDQFSRGTSCDTQETVNSYTAKSGRGISTCSLCRSPQARVGCRVGASGNGREGCPASANLKQSPMTVEPSTLQTVTLRFRFLSNLQMNDTILTRCEPGAHLRRCSDSCSEIIVKLSRPLSRPSARLRPSQHRNVHFGGGLIRSVRTFHASHSDIELTGLFGWFRITRNATSRRASPGCRITTGPSLKTCRWRMSAHVVSTCLGTRRPLILSSPTGMRSPFPGKIQASRTASRDFPRHFARFARKITAASSHAGIFHLARRIVHCSSGYCGLGLISILRGSS